MRNYDFETMAVAEQIRQVLVDHASLEFMQALLYRAKEILLQEDSKPPAK